MTKRKVLFHWPNTSNRGRIHMAMPVLQALAKERNWEFRYFDTAFYEKRDDSVLDKEATGGFKPSKSDTMPEIFPRHLVVPNFQKIIDDFKHY